MVVPNMIDVQQMPLFDTLKIAAAGTVPATQYMFTEAISATKSRALTNMTQGSRLEAPRSFVVNAIRVQFSPRIGWTDLYKLYEDYVLRLIVGDKVYQEAGIDFFPGGGGPVVSSNAAAATTASGSATVTENKYATNGLQDPRAINVLEHPVVIGQGENFRVELEGTSFTATAAIWMRVYLDGILGRQVQ